jgi:hypothetical protein
VISTTVSLPVSGFPPLALGFMGLGTGYLIYGIQEFFHYPPRNVENDVATGIWGLWLPGFFQLLAGLILFFGLTLFGTFTAPPLYMAALAFTAYGVHWFALGWIRARGRSDLRIQLGMSIGFIVISALGTLVFFKAHDNPVAGIFIGLIGVYIAELLLSLKPSFPKVGEFGERLLGFFHLGTGIWLLYMMCAVTVDFTIGYHWIT